MRFEEVTDRTGKSRRVKEFPATRTDIFAVIVTDKGRTESVKNFFNGPPSLINSNRLFIHSY